MLVPAIDQHAKELAVLKIVLPRDAAGRRQRIKAARQSVQPPRLAWIMPPTPRQTTDHFLRLIVQTNW